MSGGEKAVRNGDVLCKEVAELGRRLGLLVQEQYQCARRISGGKRYIDVVLMHPASRLCLGVECKSQESTGSAEEKIPLTIEDLSHWPIRGVVVISGDGFSVNMKQFLLSSGCVLEFGDLEPWLRLFFGLDI